MHTRLQEGGEHRASQQQRHDADDGWRKCPSPCERQDHSAQYRDDDGPGEAR